MKINKKIFTREGEMLVNLLVVLGIIAILSVISIPMLRNYQPNAELNLAVKNLSSDLRLAQQQSITEQKMHIIQINTLTNSYTLSRLDPATTTLATRSLPASVEFDIITGLSANTVKFNPYGAVIEPGSIILQSNSASSSKIINLKPSGYVEVK